MIFMLLAAILSIQFVHAQQNSTIIQANGMIKYPEPTSAHEMGLFHAHNDTQIPAEAGWVVATWKGYTAPAGQKVILSDINDVGMPRNIVTADDLAEIEGQVMLWDASKFWGVIFLSEEWWKPKVQFENGMSYTWFGQWLAGYDVWLGSHPGWTKEEWRSEMYYRLVYGFYEYFKAQGVRVGHTMGMGTVLPQNRETYFGAKAWDYIRDNSDFIFFYTYTKHLEHWLAGEKAYFDYVDELMAGGAKPFFILTQRWYDKPWWDDWEPEAIALEMKNALDRDMVITVYRYNSRWNPDFHENWALMLQSVELYKQGAPYYEEYVAGRNLLTGYDGQTYGWVQT